MGGGVLLAQLRCGLVRVLLCFFLAFDDRLEEVRVLKRSASVVAKASALMVTVLTCFSMFFKNVLDGVVGSRLHFSHMRLSPPLA